MRAQREGFQVPQTIRKSGKSRNSKKNTQDLQECGRVEGTVGEEESVDAACCVRSAYAPRALRVHPVYAPIATVTCRPGVPVAKR